MGKEVVEGVVSDDVAVAEEGGVVAVVAAADC